MSRETENTILLLVGLSIGLITFTGAFTRYVKPSLLPWLAITAVLLIGLALVAMVGDIRRGGPGHDHDDGHSHRTAVMWLLAVPVVVLIFVAPPALRPQAASVRTASNDVVHRGFPPLPAGRAPDVSLPEVLMRSAQDTSGSLTNRLITITGFVLNEPGGVDLARIVIICCAADAQLARIHLRDSAGDAALKFADNTWLRVEGRVETDAGPGAPRPKTARIPTLRVVTVTRVAAPANQYA
ncbi:MAG: TIGR03943 family protein [Mycobacterium sp.]